MGTKIQHRRDNASNWASNNPILAQGEIGFDTTNQAFRIGDGTNHWSALSEFNYGSLYFMGTWDASGGSYPASPDQGQYYVVSVAGTVSGVVYGIDDWIVYSGIAWQKINNAIYAPINNPTFTGLVTAPDIAGVKRAINTVYSNLGAPTTEEIASCASQFPNQLRFVPPTSQEESTDGNTWITSTRLFTSRLSMLMIGNGEGVADGDAEIIPITGVGQSGYYRLTWDSASYAWLNALYLYINTGVNDVGVKIEAYNNTSTSWGTICTGTTSGWPTHVWVPHTVIPFKSTDESPDYCGSIRLTFSVTSSTTEYPVNLMQIMWFGGYPAKKKMIYSVDKDKNVTFPAKVIGTSFNDITALATTAPVIDGTATIGTSTESARGDHIHPTDITRASSTSVNLTLYVYKDATGTGDGSTKANGFTTFAAAYATLPEIIAHAITIIMCKGATAYTENISVQRIVGAGSITIRAEYYWYGTNASSKTGKFDLGTGDTGYADRAQISAGDTVWMTKWTSTVLASAPLESFTDTVASVDGAEVTLTTNSAKALTTAWTYQIAKTVIQSVTVTNTSKVYVTGLIISNAGSGVTLSGAILPDIRACHITCSADSQFPIIISGGSAGITITRCWLYSPNTSANGLIVVSSTVATCTYNVVEITAVSGTSYGIKSVDSYVPVYYSHVKTALIGMIAQRGGVIYTVSCLNSGTTPISPANWAASTDGGVVL